jgi:hypothetical protein
MLHDDCVELQKLIGYKGPRKTFNNWADFGFLWNWAMKQKRFQVLNWPSTLVHPILFPQFMLDFLRKEKHES